MIIKINKKTFDNKIIACFAVIILLALIVVSQVNDDSISNNFSGDWAGVLNGKKAVFSFDGYKDCSLSIKDELLNNVLYVVGECEFDFTKTPYPMKITSNQNTSKVYHTILKIVDSRTISIARVSSKWRLRPISFDQQSFVLKKEGI